MIPYAIDLTEFFEETSLKPLLQNSVIQVKNKTYRADRIFRGEKHCYVFIDITIEGDVLREPFAKKPSVVQRMIKEKKIIVKSYI